MYVFSFVLIYPNGTSKNPDPTHHDLQHLTGVNARDCLPPSFASSELTAATFDSPSLQLENVGE